MKNEIERHLGSARSLLGQCAKQVRSRRAKPSKITHDEQEMVIGFGTACDWIRWARTLQDLKFWSKTEDKSARRAGVTESVRFTQMWTATNALFAKDSILELATLTRPLPTGEKNRFDVLYQFAAIDPSVDSKCLTTLYKLLGMYCDSAGVVSAFGKPYPTMWEVIDQKYSRPEDRKKGLGKVIRTALSSGHLPSPDGPTLIYGARNWTVHGMLLTSFFKGSRKKFLSFNANISFLLSAVLHGAADGFRKAI